jgi:hypothetical protein
VFSRGSARSGIDTPDISKITYGPEEFWHELAQIVLARFGTTLAPFGTKDLLVYIYMGRAMIETPPWLSRSGV